MYKLPKWCITDTMPGFYDMESATAIEQTAKLYKAMNDLVDEYNTFADSTNKIIEDFINGTNSDYELFKLEMAQKFEEFIGVVELKLGAQDTEIQDAINYMKSNIEPTIQKLIKDMNEAGELDEAMLDAIDNTKAYVDEQVQSVFDYIENIEVKTTLEGKAMTLSIVNNSDIQKELVEEYNSETKELVLTIGNKEV